VSDALAPRGGEDEDARQRAAARPPSRRERGTARGARLWSFDSASQPARALDAEALLARWAAMRQAVVLACMHPAEQVVALRPEERNGELVEAD